MSTVTDAIERWEALLRPGVELSPAFCRQFTEELRRARLHFGGRIHCPFLRPLFLGEAQVAEVRTVGEAIAAMGERVAGSLEPEILDAVGMSEEERELAAIDPGYAVASTASRLDAFILPDALHLAEYNGESPAGLGYTDTLVEVFEHLDVMSRFREYFEATALPLMTPLLDALMASYRDWGGAASPPTVAIVDWREVPTWAEFEILRARFEQLGVPTVVSDPRDLVFDGRVLVAHDRPIDLVYRRVLINDIVARPAECGALLAAYRANAVCVANTLRCKAPHKKAFFAVLTDPRFHGLFAERERAVAGKYVPWTRLVADGRTERCGESIDLLPYVRAHRSDLVMKPNDEYGGAGVTLGWEADERAWDETIDRAVSGRHGRWIVQERIPVHRERFPMFAPGEGASLHEMLVDCAPYLFRGKAAGFLTRLSATSLANVTSGGGQVPSFVVRRRDGR